MVVVSIIFVYATNHIIACFSFSSHLVTVPPGPLLSDALMTSPILVSEDGSGPSIGPTGFEFGVDPNEDPELALVCIAN